MFSVGAGNDSGLDHPHNDQQSLTWAVQNGVSRWLGHQQYPDTIIGIQLAGKKISLNVQRLVGRFSGQR